MSPEIGRTLRVGLWSLTAVQAAVGLTALLLPRVFYDHVVGVALLPPFNEHLLTDVGGLYLAVALVFGAAAMTLDRLLVRVALVASLLYSVPHLIFHSTHLHGFDTTTAIVQTVGLSVVVLLALGLLAIAGRGLRMPD